VVDILGDKGRAQLSPERSCHSPDIRDTRGAIKVKPASRPTTTQQSPRRTESHLLTSQGSKRPQSAVKTKLVPTEQSVQGIIASHETKLRPSSAMPIRK